MWRLKVKAWHDSCMVALLWFLSAGSEVVVCSSWVSLDVRCARLNLVTKIAGKM